jgi:hypothetical protein
MDRSATLLSPSFYAARAFCAAVIAFCLAPALGMGLLRDDWLLLWSASGHAPQGAAGVFPRPLAQAQWTTIVRLFGDAAWAPHAMAVVGWALAAVLFWRHLARRKISSPWIALAVAWWVSHGALVEARLWAAASNGVWAVALGLVALDCADHGRRRVGWEVAAWAAAALLRADALALLVLRAPRPRRRGARFALLGLFLLLGAATLAWMLQAGGDWTFRPQDSGRALRLLLVPYGGPLPRAAQLVLAATVGVGLLWVVLRNWLGAQRPSSATAAVVGVGALLAAFSLSDWSVAGRYLLVPAQLSAWLLAVGGDALGRAPRGRRPQLALAAVAWAFVAAGTVSTWVGRTAEDLRGRAAAETALYRRVRELASTPAWERTQTVVLLDAPPVGWHSSAADLENVVSVALRREVAVGRQDVGSPTTLRYVGGRWVGGGAGKMP